MRNILLVTMLLLGMVASVHAGNPFGFPNCEDVYEGKCALLKNGQRIAVVKRHVRTTVAEAKIQNQGVREKSSDTYAGYYMPPVPFKGVTRKLHGHGAIDLRCSYGTPVVAAATGRIVVVKSDGYNGGYGEYVIIEHNNGTRTLYAHLSKMCKNCIEGQVVRQGEVIAFSGESGHTHGPHLHFEVRGRGVENPFKDWPFVG